VDEDKTSWPLIVGITAGLIGGIIAGVYLYSVKDQDEPNTNLRDARDIIAQCNEQIKDLEERLSSLHQPLSKSQ
jgi:hypothetical protein